MIECIQRIRCPSFESRRFICSRFSPNKGHRLDEILDNNRWSGRALSQRVVAHDLILLAQVDWNNRQIEESIGRDPLHYVVEHFTVGIDNETTRFRFPHGQRRTDIPHQLVVQMIYGRVYNLKSDHIVALSAAHLRNRVNASLDAPGFATLVLCPPIQPLSGQHSHACGWRPIQIPSNSYQVVQVPF